MEKELILLQPVLCILPDTPDYNNWEREILDYRQEFFDKGEQTINGSRGLLHYDNIDGWLEQIRDCTHDKNSYIGVPVTTFLAVAKDDSMQKGPGYVVGNIELRHHLNPDLEELGGHIGYSVRPCERGKGYASSMLSSVLVYARSLGLKGVMLDCDADNTASLKTILKCGGVFTLDTWSLYRGKRICNRHFWISLT